MPSCVYSQLQRGCASLVWALPHIQVSNGTTWLKDIRLSSASPGLFLWWVRGLKKRQQKHAWPLKAQVQNWPTPSSLSVYWLPSQTGARGLEIDSPLSGRKYKVTLQERWISKEWTSVVLFTVLATFHSFSEESFTQSSSYEIGLKIFFIKQF